MKFPILNRFTGSLIIEENGCRFRVDSSSPRERWFMNIREGDTPSTNDFSKLALQWVEEAIFMRDHIAKIMGAK